MVFVLLASCNTFDEPSDDAAFFPGNDDDGFGFGVAGSPGPFLPSAGTGSPFAGSGVGGFGPAGGAGALATEAGSGGRGGWQLLDGGVPPPPASQDDAGDEDAGN